MKNTWRVATICLAGILGLTAAAKANLIYNFDTPGTEANNGGHGDGLDPEGWTDTIGTSRASFTVAGGRTSVVPGDQDSQNQNMVFTSPAFYLTGNTISADLSGGMGNGPSSVAAGDEPSNISSITAGPAGQNASNVLVLGLREVATGNYVSFLQKNQLADAWTGYSWDVSAFAGDGQQYVIDQIDTRWGGWGHIELDNVNIPGTLVPEPASLGMLAIAGGSVMLRRRRHA